MYNVSHHHPSLGLRTRSQGARADRQRQEDGAGGREGSAGQGEGGEGSERGGQEAREGGDQVEDEDAAEQVDGRQGERHREAAHVRERPGAGDAEEEEELSTALLPDR